MSLSSVRYILFLAAVAAVYFLLPARMRRGFLLAASYAFYAMWQPLFCVLLAVSTLVSWLCALGFERRWLKRDRLWIWIGALYLFGVLFLYKYLDFFCNTALSLMGRTADFHSGWLLPVGISFYTFSAASYLFDVKSGKLAAEKNLADYALFVAFFPSVLSGPINRAPKLLPQIKSPKDFSYRDMKKGLLRFTAGAVKKLVLADTLGIFVNAVYADLPARSGGVLALAAAAYSLQIYFDFSGYTDMAVGSARILGYELPENFRAPYLVCRVKDFWKNWHISLTSWFRDYIYFPLGGSRVSKWRTYLNVLIVFAVSGLWHGADGSFIIWGLLNGAYQVIGQITEPLKIKKKTPLLSVLRCGITFVLITVAWIFFRADTTADALYIVRSVLLIPVHGAGELSLREFIGMRQLMLAAVCTAAFALDDLHLVRKGESALAPLEEKSLPYWLFLALAAAFIAVFGVYGKGFDAQSFVYFNF